MYVSNFSGKDLDFAIENAHKRYTDSEARSSVVKILDKKGKNGNVVFKYDKENGIYADVKEDGINHNNLKNYKQEEHINWVENNTDYNIHDNNIKKTAVTKHNYSYKELGLKIDQEPTSGNKIPISSDWVYNHIYTENSRYTDEEALNAISSNSLIQKSGKYISTDQIKARNTKGIMITDSNDNGLVIRNGGSIGLNLRGDLIQKYKDDYDRVLITINGKDYYLLLEDEI